MRITGFAGLAGAVVIAASAATASAVTINFETDAAGNPYTAPMLFRDALPLANFYAPLGITFQLTTGNAGVVNDTSNRVMARSGRNFVAFQQANPIETMNFAFPISEFSIYVTGQEAYANGGGPNTSYSLQAYANNTLVSSSTATAPFGSYVNLSVTYPSGINKVVLKPTTETDFFTCDDLTFTPITTLALRNAVNAQIITGGTATLGATVANLTAPSGSSVNYTLAAAVQSGGGTLGTASPASGSLSPGQSQSCTVSATSTNFGANKINFTATDPNAPSNPGILTATLTVLDHSNASLSSGTAQTSQVIDFGNVLRGAVVPGKSFTIYNRAANTSAANTTKLKLTGFTSAGGDSALSTNLANFNGLAAGGGKTYTASLNTANYTSTGTKTISMAASQLADDSSLSGADGNNCGGLTVTLKANVGNATADASNSQAAFGPELTAAVAANAGYANLQSNAATTTGSRGYSLIGSTATILAGTNTSSGAAQTVGMSWRTQTLAERANPGLTSDVVHLTGMALDGFGRTDPFVLQMTYNPALLPGGAGNEALWASSKRLYLGWLNPETVTWENAVDSNFGTNQGGFHLGAWTTGDMYLGHWGVNTANHTVWAVLDHNSDFAVVPEPSTLALLAGGGIGLIVAAWRRKRRYSQAATASSQDDMAAPLPFPLRPAQRTATTRRAA